MPEHLCRPAVNLFRLTLHPEGLAAHTATFDQWARQMLAQLVRLADTSADPRLDALLDEVSAYPNVAEVVRDHPDRVRHPGRRVGGRAGHRGVLPGRRRHRGPPAIPLSDSS